MQTIEKKTLRTSVNGIGNMELTMLIIGKETWLNEIELFITQSSDKFQIIACQKVELKNPLFMQRAIQAFINHIQAGGEEQKANLIRNHFRNWINKQNGSLKTIIYGEKETNADGSDKTLRESVQAEFNRRYRGRQ